MENIEFEAETYKPFKVQTSAPKKSWAVSLVMKLSGGRVKTEKQASNILLVIIVIFMAVSIYNFTSKNSKPLSKEEIQKLQNSTKELPINNSTLN